MNLTLERLKTIALPFLGAVIFYVLFAYYLERSEFISLLLLYGALFFVSWRIIEHSKLKFWTLVAIGICFRLLFLPAIPNLSQDFYRFLWDGRLLIQGVNPYILTPLSYMTDLSTASPIDSYWRALEVTSGNTVTDAAILYNGMGELNASHYSNYPPVNQLCFAIAALLSGKSIVGSVVVLRVLILLADIGIVILGKKLLERLKLPSKNIFWYFLNPFIIIELTGNLHFEGVMLFFLVVALYALCKKKWFWAAVLLGISISVKLLPLLLLPLFFGYFVKFKKNVKETTTSPFPALGIFRLITFYVVVLVVVLLTFAPFLSSAFIANFSATIALWFQNFEFNASVYYIIRWIGYQTVGWNIIGTAGKILPIIVVIALLALAFFRRNTTLQQLITAMLFGVSIYFLLSTTVHPWYVATPLILSVFTTYKFPIVWSFFVILSYSAYGANGFDENLWLVALEYVVVISFAITEISSKTGKRHGNFRVVER
ncbi:MAG: mannosyltransferase [Flavobacteriaceae bacterium]|nr:mannosyltransferase [Flavobacteriaceae bacterium]